jgi:hypothetical protein
MKTLSQLAQDALNVQDACNLSGVVHGFSRAMTDLRELLPKAGTDEINTHPISVMWSNKIASLTRSDDHKVFYDAYECVQKYASEKPNELRVKDRVKWDTAYKSGNPNIVGTIEALETESGPDYASVRWDGNNMGFCAQVPKERLIKAD